MLEEGFPELLPLVAVGLTGSGSECFGYDDAVSRDHDFEPGFCIFIPGPEQVDEKQAFALQRAYDHLPKEFMGFTRKLIGPTGGSRHGVLRISDFFIGKCGAPDGVLTTDEWLMAPEYALAEATNGSIFYDESGDFTKIRSRLQAYPDDIRLKKLAGYLLTMGQSGQYNYDRCMSRGETGAAQMAMYEFVNAAMHVIFLLNRSYMPYYKWSFRALRQQTMLGSMADSLEYLISSDNEENNAFLKESMAEDVAGLIIDQLHQEGITKATCMNLETHAYSVNDFIKDASLRNMNIFAGV